MNPNRLLHPLSLIVILTAFSCTDLLAQDWKYLGKTPPGETPVRFATSPYLATQQWFWHGVPAFSPDGTDLFFTKYLTAANRTEIWFSSCTDGVWSTPQRAPFSNGTDPDNNPLFAGNNDTLYFQSERPVPALYTVVRSQGAWSSPIPVNLPVPAGKTFGKQFSIARNGNIYGELSNTQGGNLELYYWQKAGQQYQNAVRLATLCSNQDDGFPTVDANEQFIVFASNRTGGAGYFDLYLSCKNTDGSWSQPESLGTKFNSASEDAWSCFSPDGSWFFFTTARAGDAGYNPYWVSAQVITDLNPNTGITSNGNHPGTQLFQNQPNPCDKHTIIPFQLEHPDRVTLDLFDITGTQIQRLLNNRHYPAGSHAYPLDLSGLRSGVYTYALTTDSGSRISRKMIVGKQQGS